MMATLTQQFIQSSQDLSILAGFYVPALLFAIVFFSQTCFHESFSGFLHRNIQPLHVSSGAKTATCLKIGDTLCSGSKQVIGKSKSTRLD